MSPYAHAFHTSSTTVPSGRAAIVTI
jgi:hypothetical protein